MSKCNLFIRILALALTLLMLSGSVAVAGREDTVSALALMLGGVPRGQAIEIVESAPKRGDRGERILEIKKQLQALGYYRPTATFDDEFNDTMVERLKMFQRNNGLTATGKYDVHTQAVMQSGEKLVKGQWYEGDTTSGAKNIDIEDSRNFEIETIGKGTCRITRYLGETVNVVIPQRIRGYQVTHIGYSAFRDCKTIESIVIPEGVTCIEGTAFCNCKNLRSIELPESLISMDDRVFMDCENLAEVRIPDSVMKIQSNPFVGCKTLERVVISSNHARLKFVDGMLIDKTEKRLIGVLPNVDHVDIPEDIIEIGDYAFELMLVLRKVIIPEGVKRIGNWAFNACKLLNEVQIPQSVTQIGRGAFAYSTYLNKVNIPNGIKVIEADTFSHCQELRSEELMLLEIPESVEEIGNGAFAGCEKLRVMVIPKSVKKIGNAVFKGCKSLWKVRMLTGDDVEMGVNVFVGCDKLQWLTKY